MGLSNEKYRTDENRQYIDFTKDLLKQADINISSIEVDAKEVLGEEYDWNELRIVLSEIKRLKEI